METLLNTHACTLPTADRPVRLAEFDDLFAADLSGVERRGNSARFRLAGKEGLADRVHDLTARESQCCSFFEFSIEGPDHDLVVDVSVPPARREVLDALVTRAEELKP